MLSFTADNASNNRTQAEQLEVLPNSFEAVNMAEHIGQNDLHAKH
jgi:hypothetical protein